MKRGEGEGVRLFRSDGAEADPENEDGMWEETFKSHHDSKPYGKNSSILIIDGKFSGLRSIINRCGCELS
jgi:hypothetical protein